MQTPEQYLEWCKQRAFDFCDRGDTLGALLSMSKDVERSPYLRNDLREWLLMCNQILEVGLLKTAAGAREIIEDFAYYPFPPPITPSAPRVFTEGQSITVEGIQGPGAHWNGTYAVASVNPGTITP